MVSEELNKNNISEKMTEKHICTHRVDEIKKIISSMLESSEKVDYPFLKVGRSLLQVFMVVLGTLRTTESRFM